MNDDPLRSALQTFFRLGAFIGVGGLLMALWSPLDSGEFVVSVCSAMMGGMLMLGVAVVVRLTRRSHEDSHE